jgi:hypothetical protein
MPTTDGIGPFPFSREVTLHAYDQTLSGGPVFSRHFEDLTITSPPRGEGQPEKAVSWDRSHFTRLDIRDKVLIKQQVKSRELLPGTPARSSSPNSRDTPPGDFLQMDLLDFPPNTVPRDNRKPQDVVSCLDLSFTGTLFPDPEIAAISPVRLMLTRFSTCP